MIKDLFRQGDVLLEKTRRKVIPKDATHLETRVVAEGEHSNHVHRLTSGVKLFGNKTKDIFAFVPNSTGGILEHIKTTTNKKADHEPIKLDGGIYKVIIQRELNPFTKVSERVWD